MELCILKFRGSDEATDALQWIMDETGDHTLWLHDVGTISRPLVGRVRVETTFPDGKSETYREGDLADAAESLGAYTGYYLSALTGPLSSMFRTVNAGLEAGARGREMEERLFHLDALKKALPRDSSALVLIASPPTCDALDQMFKSYTPRPEVIRREVSEELRLRLEALHRMMAQEMAPPASASAPAPH
jgi:hypothetical protein